MSTASQTIRKLFSRSLSRALSIWGVAIVAAMLVGQAASGSPVVLYDSINGSTAFDSDPANNGSWLANQFNTDAASYTLQSVVLDSDASGTPNTSLGTLTNPGSFGAGSNTFSATGIPTLATASSFWVVLRGVGSGSVSWNWTSDTPTGFGSSTNTNLSGNSGQTWGGLVSGSPYMMTINATSAAVPEIDPASFGSALSLVLGSLSLLGRRRRQG